MKLVNKYIYFFKQLELTLIVLFCLFFLLDLSAQQIPLRPKVAVVLSGGGAKGFAHVGVLKILEQEGIPVDIVVGTSMGSIVGGMYAIGYSAAQIEQMCKSQDWSRLFSDKIPRRYLSPNDQLLQQRYFISIPFSEKNLPSLPQGVITGQNVLNYFCALAGNVPENVDFCKLPIAFACVSTNLETGAKVVLKDGFLPTAIFSSMAIPGVFSPCNRDGKLLVDGGLVDNFPYDVAKSMGADIIIGVDIRNSLATQDKLRSIPNIVNQLISLYDPVQDSINKKQCNIIIRPDIKGYGNASFNNRAVDTLIQRGERAAIAMLPQIRALKKEFSLPDPKVLNSPYIMPDKWMIMDIRTAGSFSMDESLICNYLQLKTPGLYSYEDIKKAIDKLYGQESFEKIYFSLEDYGKGKLLKLYLYQKKDYTQNIGFKVNTTDAAALLLNINRLDYSKMFGLFSLSAELSANPGLSALGEFHAKGFPSIGLKIDGKHQKYNIYTDGDKSSSADLYYAAGSLYFYQHFYYMFNVGLGVRQEYYYGDIFNKNNTTITDETKSFITNPYGYISFDNYDDFYFPRSGTNFYGEFSFIKDLTQQHGVCPALLIKVKNVIPCTKKTALLFNFYSRSLYNDNYPSFKATFAGGVEFSHYFSYQLPFIGLSSVTPIERFSDIALLGLRYRIARKHYLSFMGNALVQNDEFVSFNNYSLILGGGVGYSIKSNMGPIDFVFGYSDYNHTPTFSANLGYWF